MLRSAALALLAVAVCHAAVLGGYSDLDKDSDEAKSVLKFAETTLNAQSNSLYSSKVSSVISVQRQLVNGVNYKVVFEFATTSCVKSSMIALETCPLSDKAQKCSATVYKSFAGEMDLTDFDCEQIVKRERRAGQLSPPVDDPSLYTDEAVKALSGTNSLLDTTDDSFKVLEVRTQVVAGLKKYIKVQGLIDGVANVCDFSIWSRAWIDGDEGYQISPLECQPVKSNKGERKTRSVEGGACPGCVGEERPVDETTISLLTQALAGYNDELAGKIDLENTKFISMRTQVVAGIKYYIKLQTEIDGKTKKCDLSFVNAPWQTPANQMMSLSCAE